MTGAFGHQDAGESRQTNAIYNNIYNGFLPAPKIARIRLKALVGPRGFEPRTSCTPSKRASQAAPRPELVHSTAELPGHRPAILLRRSISTTSRQRPSICPSRSRVPTIRNPARLCSAMLA
jgi:hypothetical protein